MLDAETKIGYKFKNKNLLRRALTHSSYANENHTRDNERLEFLGDSVLSLIISENLFGRMQDIREGDLSKLRAALVCEGSLAAVAKKIALGELIFLGRGEEMSGGRRRPSIVSDAFEAVLAAIYLDGGFGTAKSWLLPLMADRIEDALAGRVTKDYKTALQEIIQSDGRSAVSYRTVKEEGQEHNRVFTVEALINGTPASSASGHSKKEAEQAAARAAIEKIRDAKV